LIEAAYHYQRTAANGEKIRRRQQGQPAHIINIPWRAQRRLNARRRQLKHQRRKPNGVVAVAIARELAAFCWEIALADQPRALNSGRRGGSGLPALAHNSPRFGLSATAPAAALGFRQRTCDETRSWGTSPRT
jgi:hypothetical protein